MFAHSSSLETVVCGGLQAGIVPAHPRLYLEAGRTRAEIMARASEKTAASASPSEESLSENAGDNIGNNSDSSS